MIKESAPLLTAHNLSAYYNHLQAVKNVSFEIFRGRTLAIVGESGSGKSTLALTLVDAHAGRIQGQIFYRNRPLAELSSLRGSKITMIFQDPTSALNPVYTIGWQLLETIHLHFNLNSEQAFLKAIESLKEVQIDDPEGVFHKYPHELSGGQKQRAMIAMATVVRPDILIADEPTTALDATIQMEIIHLIQRLKNELGMAVLLISHDLGTISELADDIMVMYAGEIVETGPAENLLKNPLHPYTQALVKASFLDPDEKGRLIAIKGNVPALSLMPSGCRFHPRCPFAFDKCMSGEVSDFSRDSQKVKCWLYE